VIYRLKFFIASVAFLLGLSLAAFGGHAKQTSNVELHLADPHAARLYSQSVFMHGYIHGYEEGFHNADVDIQMAHGFRDVSTLDAYKKVAGYRSSFGDKQIFEAGYRHGFRVGYTDCISGRNFRAIQLLRAAALGLSLTSLSPAARLSFDLGVQEGYIAGENEGLHDGRASLGSRNMVPGCTPLDQNHNQSRDANYCNGFRRAFLVGYSDGYTNQQDNPHLAVK